MPEEKADPEDTPDIAYSPRPLPAAATSGNPKTMEEQILETQAEPLEELLKEQTNVSEAEPEYPSTRKLTKRRCSLPVPLPCHPRMSSFNRSASATPALITL